MQSVKSAETAVSGSPVSCDKILKKKELWRNHGPLGPFASVGEQYEDDSKYFEMSASSTHCFPSMAPPRTACRASWAQRPGRNPCEQGRKSASYTGSSSITIALCATLSSNVGMPRGRLVPSAFGDVVPPDRRRAVAPGLDPAQKLQQVGLQVLLVVRRCHAVDACRALLARQPLRLLHPFVVDAAVQRREHPLGMLPRLFGYPLLFRERVRGTHRFLQRFLPVVLSMWRPPFLGRVPAVPVPRRQRYYEGTTTPRTASLRLIASPAGTTLCLLVRSRSPAGRGGPGPFVAARGPCSGLSAWTVTGPPQVPRRAIPWLCARSLTPDDPLRLACSGARGAAPAIIKTKASTLRISRLNSVASPPAVYASRRALPHAMQHALPAGGLRLCRAGVEPAGSRCKVSDCGRDIGYPVPPARIRAGALTHSAPTSDG